MSDKLKAVAALVMATLGALVTALGVGDDTSLANLDWKTWLVALGTIVGSGYLVYLVENVFGIAGGIAKAAQALLTTGIASLVVALDDGHVTQAEFLTAAMVAIAATGIVYQLPSPAPTATVAVK